MPLFSISMALFSSVSRCMLLLLSFFFFTCFSLDDSVSLPLPLTSLPNSKHSNSKTKTDPQVSTLSSSHSSLHVKSSVKYSSTLVVTLPIGTPPQPQQLVLDTGSQLSWIKCQNKNSPQKGQQGTALFDPSRSSSFASIPCNDPLCKPEVPDFTLPTECDQNKSCHYSYFYADGAFAEGNLVKEKISFSASQVTPPIIIGCAVEPQDAVGILGMNLGAHSFPAQTKINKFSYCVPLKQSQATSGSFYLGKNPASTHFRYVNWLTFKETQRMPNLDPLAYTVPMKGISIAGKKLNIPPAVFKPDAGGSGQTMIDSGSELSYFVDVAYNVIREELVKKVGPKIKKNYMYSAVADICFDGDAVEIGRWIGDMVFEFEKGVEIVIPKERVLIEVERGVHCLAIGKAERLGTTGGNIIGNFHQQNLWVEFDLGNRRVGFGEALDCGKTVK